MDKEKIMSWVNSHKILSVFLGIVSFIIIIGVITPDSPTTTPTPQVASTPQTYEDRIKAMAVKTGTTNISYKGIEDVKADSNRPEGSRMITVSLNIGDYYNASALYKNTGELSGKIMQETFASNPNVYDVIVWYYAEMTDSYGNKENKVLISQGIDKDTYQKINWQNFDSTKLCDFLKTEGTKNGGETACVVLANIK